MATTVASQVSRKVPSDQTTPADRGDRRRRQPGDEQRLRRRAAQRLAGRRRRPGAAAAARPRQTPRGRCHTTSATVAASHSQPDGKSDHWVARPRQ